MKRFAIIPARGGSKRLPRKNIRHFRGKPAIGHTVQVLKRSNLFDRIIVSTDDAEIADISVEFGAEIPWKRPPELSDDITSTDAVIKHSIIEIKKKYGNFEVGCCVYPVNLLLTESLLIKGLEEMIASAAPSSFPIVSYEFPIQQAFTLRDQRLVFYSEFDMDQPSQTLDKYFHDAGMFYWFNVERYLESPKLFSNRAAVFEIDNLCCQDVNTMNDWLLAEMKLEMLEKQNSNEN